MYHLKRPLPLGSQFVGQLSRIRGHQAQDSLLVGAGPSLLLEGHIMLGNGVTKCQDSLQLLDVVLGLELGQGHD